jgi:rare lipoprotein A
MSRRQALRQPRLAQAAVGAAIIAIPPSASALADVTTNPPPQGGIDPHLRSHHVGYERDVVITGEVPASEARKRVYLNYSATGTGRWRRVTSSLVRRDGHFRLAAPLRRSGTVDVTGSWQQPTIGLPSAGAASATGASAPERVVVGARLQLHSHVLSAATGGAHHVRGRLLPGTGGRRVKLEALEHGHWKTLARGHTGRRGAFDLRFAPRNRGANSEPLRVVFGGDSLNGPTLRGAGALVFFRQSLASWYDDGGNTACGFHAYYGVANVSLPCGTKVTFSYGGRTVTATVDDRGPYVGGREWDLNQNTAGALGFGGVATVWSSR